MQAVLSRENENLFWLPYYPPVENVTVKWQYVIRQLVIINVLQKPDQASKGKSASRHLEFHNVTWTTGLSTLCSCILKDMKVLGQNLYFLGSLLVSFKIKPNIYLFKRCFNSIPQSVW